MKETTHQSIQRIGTVPIYDSLKADERTYSDGDSEDVLLNLYSSENSDKKVKQLLAEDCEWPIFYHITPARENLLNWYPFTKTDSLLEVGAGCGALTGMLTGRCGRVDAVDISPRRSLINAHRNRSARNLRIVISNMQTLGEEYNDYDYVTSVGVLEYAARFITGENPHLDFLRSLHSRLKAGGSLILAIENRLGLKYWAGAREDHTGVFFDSIEDYPSNAGIMTFGKQELTKLLKQSGFKKIEFYYPFPDYKIPIEVYSHSLLSDPSMTISSDIFPSPALDQDRQYIFDEKLVSQSLIKNGLMPEFSNSFLVFAQKERD